MERFATIFSHAASMPADKSAIQMLAATALSLLTHGATVDA